MNNNVPITHETLFGKHDVYLEEAAQKTKHDHPTIFTKITNEKLDSLQKLSKEITLEDTSFLLPQGKEKIFLVLYAFLLPYITGLIFLFSYIAEVDFNLFISMLDEHSYFLTWCIGYEILMFSTLSILIIKNLMLMRNKNPNTLKLKTL